MRGREPKKTARQSGTGKEILIISGRKKSLAKKTPISRSGRNASNQGEEEGKTDPRGPALYSCGEKNPVINQ